MRPLDELLNTARGQLLSQGGVINGAFLVGDCNGCLDKQTIGFSDMAAEVDFPENPQFLIGSVTKQFIAVGVVTALYHDAIKDLDAKDGLSDETIKKEIEERIQLPLSIYLDKNDDIWDGRMPQWAKDITLHRLLTHTSRLKNYTELCGLDHLRKSICAPSDIVSLFKDEELVPEEHCMGEDHHQYSNSNYLLLGIVLERLSGYTQQKALNTYFFDGLGMEDTIFATKGTPDTLRGEPGYEKLVCGNEVRKLLGPIEIIIAVSISFVFLVISTLMNLSMTPGLVLLGAALLLPIIQHCMKFKKSVYPDYEPMHIPLGSGSLISTTEDLHKWLQDLFVNNECIPSVVADIVKNNGCELPFSYGNGWKTYYCYGLEKVVDDASKQVIRYGHGGCIPGFQSKVYFYPRYEICYIELDNVQSPPLHYSCDSRPLPAIEKNFALSLFADSKSNEINNSDTSDLALEYKK